jgi:hypothetical protein
MDRNIQSQHTNNNMEYYSDSNGQRVLVRHRGPAGIGIPVGGTDGQILAKTGTDDYATEWVNPPDGTDAVLGPASSLDATFALFDGITGKLLKDSGQVMTYFSTKSYADTKEDSVPGKGLSQEDFTTVLKAKLDALNPAGFKGVFADIGDITGFVPISGDYCTIEVLGDPIELVLWDDTNNTWVSQTPPAFDATGQEIADILFNPSDAVDYDNDTCRIYTTTEKAQVAAHEAFLNAFTGGTSGGQVEAISVKTASYTATTADRTILCDASTGALTIALPPAATVTGRIYTIKKIDSSINAVTVDADLSEVIDAATTASLPAQYDKTTIQSNGTGWSIIG